MARDLTARELEILGYIAEGFQDKQTARELNLSSRTVQTHCNRIVSKLGANSRANAIYIAMKKGFLV